MALLFVLYSLDVGKLDFNHLRAQRVLGTALSAIHRKRDERPFASVANLYRRTPVWRAALENLIGAGFLDRLRLPQEQAALLGETSDLPCPPVR